MKKSIIFLLVLMRSKPQILNRQGKELFIIPYSLQEAVYDSRYRRNLNGPFDTAENAVASMLED